MNKQLILDTLKKYNLDKDNYMILSNSSMVLQDLKEEANVIDIAVCDSYLEYILNNFKCVKQDNSYILDNIINISTNYNKNDIVYYNDYPLQRIDKVRDMKLKIGKDIEDINIINKYLNLNPLALAYLGDGVYELYIRKYLIDKGIIRVEQLCKESIKYVSAKSQSKYLDLLINNNILTSDEIEIVKKGRNSKSHKAPKNTDIRTYKNSTGFEALIGYLYLTNNTKRLDKIIKEIIGD